MLMVPAGWGALEEKGRCSRRWLAEELLSRKVRANGRDTRLSAHTHEAHDAHEARQPGILHRSVPANAHDARWLRGS